MVFPKINPPRQEAQFSESGFTIIESLIAIVIVSILLSAIAPVILLSVSTRVQSRRVELAADAASAYIDGVRSGRIQEPGTLAELTTTPGQTPLGNFPVPKPPLNCDNKANQYCVNTSDSTLFCIDGDGDGHCRAASRKDFIIQAFRYTKPATSGSPPNTADNGYQLGLRVYRADAFNGNGALQKSPNKQPSFTGRLGNPKIPYFETTTEISTGKTTFSDFCDRLDSRPAGSTANNPNPSSLCR